MLQRDEDPCKYHLKSALYAPHCSRLGMPLIYITQGRGCNAGVGQGKAAYTPTCWQMRMGGLGWTSGSAI